MKYHYHGIEAASRQRVNGEVEAVTRQDALRTLAQKRIEVTRLTQVETQVRGGRRVKPSDLVLPMQELATLTESGVTLIDAVLALAANKEHPKLADGFSKIAAKVEGGGSFSQAVEESKLPFPEYVSNLVQAGELGGQLPLALRNAATQMEYDQSVRGDIRSALTYPFVLIGSGIGAMLIIFFAVVPKFSHLLNGEKELPTLAYWVLSAGKLANDSPLMILAVLSAIVLSLAVILGNRAVRQKIVDWLVEVPVIGPWLSEMDAARWASLCSAMLVARVSLISALKLAAKSCQYTRRKQRAFAMIDEIESGVSFSEALSQARLIPETSLNLVSVGDRTGQLAEMLSAVARLHDTSCKRRMKQVLTLMEPIAILLVGVLIGVMILGIVLAITASTDIAI